MPRAGFDVRFENFKRGMSMLDATGLEPGEASLVENCFLEDEVLKPRYGDLLINTLAAPGVAARRLIAAGDLLFALASGPVIYSINATGAFTNLGAFGSTTTSEIVRAPSATQGPYFMATVGTMLQSNGAVPWTAWTASSGTLPASRRLCTAGNRLWHAVVTNYGTVDPGSTVVWSDIGESRSYPAANVTMFGPGDGEQINGLIRLGEGLLVTKPSRQWFVYDLDTSANREIGLGGMTGDGLTNSAAVLIETPQGVVAINQNRGLVVTNGSDIKVIDDRMVPLFKYLGSQLAPSNSSMIFRAVYLDDSIYMLLTADQADGGRFLWQYNMSHGTWFRHRVSSAFDIALLAGSAAGDRRNRLYSLEGSSASWRLVRLLDTPTSFVMGDGLSITPYWQSGLHDFGLHNRKRLSSVFFSDSGGARMDIYTGATNAITSNAGPVWTPTGLLQTYVNPFSGSARAPASGVSERFMIALTGFNKVTELTMRMSARGRS